MATVACGVTTLSVLRKLAHGLSTHCYFLLNEGSDSSRLGLQLPNLLDRKESVDKKPYAARCVSQSMRSLHTYAMIYGKKCSDCH